MQKVQKKGYGACKRVWCWQPWNQQIRFKFEFGAPPLFSSDPIRSLCKLSLYFPHIRSHQLANKQPISTIAPIISSPPDNSFSKEKSAAKNGERRKDLEAKRQCWSSAAVPTKDFNLRGGVRWERRGRRQEEMELSLTKERRVWFKIMIIISEK